MTAGQIKLENKKLYIFATIHDTTLDTPSIYILDTNLFHNTTPWLKFKYMDFMFYCRMPYNYKLL